MAFFDDAPTATPSGDSAVPHPGDDARARAADTVKVELTKVKRGRPSTAERLAKEQSTASAAANAARDAEVTKQLETLFKPELWGHLCVMPANAMLAATGHKHWEINEADKNALGSAAAMSARFLAITDPKTLAFVLFGATVLGVYGPRIAMEAQIRRQEKEAEKKK